MEKMDNIFEYIVDTIHEPLLVLNKDLKILSANRHFYDTFKVTEKETMGNLIYDLGNGQWDIPELRTLLEDIILQNDKFDKYEVDHVFPSIGHKIMVLNARRIIEKEIGSHMILLAIEDITERRYLESLLEESEERYRRLFETANDGILLLEKREGTVTHANPAVTKMLGYSKEEFIGKKLEAIGISLNIDDIQQMIIMLNRHGIIHNEDIPIRTKAGQTIYTDIYLVDRARLFQCNIRDITERKLADDASINYQSQLRALAGHLQSIREDERANIAREIHDSLGQATTGLKIELTNLKDIIPKSSDKKKNDTIHKMINEMNEQINSLIESVRRISSELRPGVLDDLGLIAALEWQLQDFGNRNRINTVYSSTIDSISLNEKTTTALFRIFQESLTNITRHAKATKVELRVKKMQNQLILEIEDNGRGITEAEILDKSSLGIMGMKERSILIGGEITFSGKPGEGTIVSVITPVKEEGSDI